MLKEFESEREQEVEGVIIPESATRKYLAMQVLAVGDGKMQGSDFVVKRRMCVAPGDRVFVQFNPQMLANNGQKVGNQKYLVLNHHDIIAKIDSETFKLSISKFNPIGRWVLVSVYAPEKIGVIYLPNQQPLQSVGEVKTFLLKAGEIATEELGLPIGTRLLLDHSRVHPMFLDKVHCAYVDITNVAGSIPSEINLDHA